MHTGTGVTSSAQDNTDISNHSLYSSSACLYLVWLSCEHTQSSVQHLPSHVHCQGLLNTAFARILAGISVLPPDTYIKSWCGQTHTHTDTLALALRALPMLSSAPAGQTFHITE